MPQYKVRLTGGVEVRTDYIPQINWDLFHIIVKARNSIRFSGHTLMFVPDCVSIALPLNGIHTFFVMKRTIDEQTGDLIESWEELWQRPNDDYDSWKQSAIYGFDRIFKTADKSRRAAERPNHSSVLDAEIPEPFTMETTETQEIPHDSQRTNVNYAIERQRILAAFESLDNRNFLRHR